MITIEHSIIKETAKRLNLDIQLVQKVVSTYVDIVWDEDFFKPREKRFQDIINKKSE